METAEATAARAAANELSARAGVNQARAALSSAQTNLSKASIVSPINGVVLKREIEPGQTVAASFEAPVLFKLAEDLSKMELQVDVDEADVGQVRDGQQAQFTVDAYPGRKFPASIRRVNYGSQTKDNVVSYKTILTVDNTDLSLRPGMTATAEITTLSRSGVLLVPNAALRFTPPEPTQPAPKGGGIVSSLIRARPINRPRRRAATARTARRECGCCERDVPPRAGDGGIERRPPYRDHRRRLAGEDAGDHRGRGRQTVSSGREAAAARRPLLELAGVTKAYGEGAASFQALRGIDVSVDDGEFVAIMGPSGSGK